MNKLQRLDSPYTRRWITLSPVHILHFKLFMVILSMKWELAANSPAEYILQNNSGVISPSPETNLHTSFQEQSMAQISPWLEGSSGFVKQTNLW